MITSTTTTVYCRVDLPSRRIVGLSDVVIPVEEGKPVYTVAANDPKVSHYIVIEDVLDAYGIGVRVADATEITAIDITEADRAVATITAAKQSKTFALKGFFDEQFIRRFRTRGFLTTAETLAAWQYTGLDPDGVVAAKKLEAEDINNWYNEWRFGNTQVAIDAMIAALDMGIAIDEEYRTLVNDDLDAFLIARGLDILIYHR